MQDFNKEFRRWKIIHDTPNNELYNTNKIQLINLWDFILKHKISPWNFDARDKKLSEIYTLCNMKTMQLLWEQNEKFFGKDKRVLFLGTKIILKAKGHEDYQCYPMIGHESGRIKPKYFIGTHHDISSYHYSTGPYGISKYYVAVY